MKNEKKIGKYPSIYRITFKTRVPLIQKLNFKISIASPVKKLLPIIVTILISLILIPSVQANQTAHNVPVWDFKGAEANYTYLIPTTFSNSTNFVAAAYHYYRIMSVVNSSYQYMVKYTSISKFNPFNNSESFYNNSTKYNIPIQYQLMSAYLIGFPGYSFFPVVNISMLEYLSNKGNFYFNSTDSINVSLSMNISSIGYPYQSMRVSAYLANLSSSALEGNNGSFVNTTVYVDLYSGLILKWVEDTYSITNQSKYYSGAILTSTNIPLSNNSRSLNYAVMSLSIIAVVAVVAGSGVLLYHRRNRKGQAKILK